MQSIQAKKYTYTQDQRYIPNRENPPRTPYAKRYSYGRQTNIDNMQNLRNINDIWHDRYKNIDEVKTSHKLGEGSFGCVIRGPFILSTNELNNRLYKGRMGEVFKLMVNKHDFKTEIRNTVIANKIDNGAASIIIEGFSILDKTDIRQMLENVDDDDMQKMRNKIRDCEVIEKYIHQNINEIYQIIYSVEGINLEVLHDKYPKSVFSLRKIFGMCFNLVKGLSRYGKHSFVHMDIKPNNIIYIPRKINNPDKMVFIDFGLSGYIKDINLNIFKYVKNIYLLPEIIAYNVIRTHTDSRIDKNKLFQIFKTSYEESINNLYENFKDLVVHYLYNDNYLAYKDELYRLFMSIYQKNNIEVEAMIRKNLIYLDAYKLSFSIMELIEQYKYRDSKDVDIFYANILLPVAFIDPNKRVPIHIIATRYRDFLQNLQKNIRHPA